MFPIFLTEVTEELTEEIAQVAAEESLFSMRNILAIIVVATAVLLSAFVRRIYYRYIDKLRLQGSYKDNSSPIPHQLVSILNVIIVIIAASLLIELFSIPVTTVVRLLILVGALLGLALQDEAKDIIMGMKIQKHKFYSIGDAVRYHDIEGQVISFTYETTKIQNIHDNSVVSISNRNVSEIVRLGNQFDIDLPLSYKQDIDMVFDILREVASEIALDSNVDDCKFLGLQEYDESAILYRIRVFAHPEVFDKARRTANYIIKINLESRGIEVPFNQLDVHVDSIDKFDY